MVAEGFWPFGLRYLTAKITPKNLEHVLSVLRPDMETARPLRGRAVFLVRTIYLRLLVGPAVLHLPRNLMSV